MCEALSSRVAAPRVLLQEQIKGIIIIIQGERGRSEEGCLCRLRRRGQRAGRDHPFPMFSGSPWREMDLARRVSVC
jgi:hypothetical protein